MPENSYIVEPGAVDDEIHWCTVDDELLDDVVARHVAAPLAWDATWRPSAQDVAATRQLMVDQLAHGTGMVVLARGGAGLTGFVWAFDPRSVGRPLTATPSLHIGSLWVDPARRGRGLAGRLMGEVEAHARVAGIARLTSEVHVSNLAMQQVQRRWGYRELGHEGPWLSYEKTLDAE